MDGPEEPDSEPSPEPEPGVRSSPGSRVGDDSSLGSTWGVFGSLDDTETAEAPTLQLVTANAARDRPNATTRPNATQTVAREILRMISAYGRPG